MLFLIVLGGLAFLLVSTGATYGQGGHGPYSLSLLALVGVIVLLGALLVFTSLVRAIGLSDPNQALGLPEGSVRAPWAFCDFGIICFEPKARA
jgi:hypothetical protein